MCHTALPLILELYFESDSPQVQERMALASLRGLARTNAYAFRVSAHLDGSWPLAIQILVSILRRNERPSAPFGAAHPLCLHIYAIFLGRS